MRLLFSAAVLLAATPAFAQQAEMPPIDRELWQTMSQAIAGLSMPMQAHQQVQQIMQNVEQEAAKRKAKRDSDGPKPAPESR